MIDIPWILSSKYISPQIISQEIECWKLLIRGKKEIKKREQIGYIDVFIGYLKL